MANIAATIMTLLLVMVPAKPYVQPDQPMEIRFLRTERPEAQKAYDALGLQAVKLPELFSAAAADDIADQSGLPEFNAYVIDPATGMIGAALKAKSVAKVDLSQGVVDAAAFYPQLREPGSYVLTWKTATPLVVQTLRNPIPWGFANDASKPGAQRQEVVARMKKDAAVITHIVPLQYAVISTDKGEMKATFDYAAAPNTVQNFIRLANERFYDGSAFHRTIAGFMIQGGDSLATTADRAGSGGPGYQIAAEFNDKLHVRGVLSMARLGLDVNTAGSQFFIIHQKAPHLDGQYTGFGQVIEGLDVLDKIAATPTTDANGSTNPKDRVGIKSVRILPGTVEMYGLKK